MSSPEFIRGHAKRTDGVHCRESVGTGPVVLKVVPAHGFVPVRDKCFLLLLHVYHLIISCNIPADVIDAMNFDAKAQKYILLIEAGLACVAKKYI